MTFSLHQGGVVMSSQITRTHIIKIHLLSHILDHELRFSVVAPFLQFITIASCNGTPPLSR